MSTAETQTQTTTNDQKTIEKNITGDSSTTSTATSPQDDGNDNRNRKPPADSSSTTTPRPFMIYTRKELLHLSKSPLVTLPPGMPALKDWFGESNEQALSSNKKDSETSSSNAAGRDRRYRRDAEDGDSSARPPFRSALSQPSQMGNFKHQSLRGTDRERDRERDTERDLRSLADRYDRERGRVGSGLPSNSSILRTRDREPASHLTSGSSNRTASQEQPTSRRNEPRESAKKKNGEISEDWRRGAEPARSGRDDDHSRRDDRERPDSRDASKHRSSPPSSRRDREHDRDRDDKDRRGDRDNQDYSRREKDRERDRDRFVDLDEDPRRWRDDGKRDERMAERRAKGRLDRLDDGRVRESSRDIAQDRDSDRDRDASDSKRDRDGWTVEDRKRSQRDRRSGAADDNKHRDREDKKEREKEKEPAWMETYIPTTTGGGILGGLGSNGEVDGIQAWKREMKEKASAEAKSAEAAKGEPPQPTQPTGSPLDEIQLFKLMMKREEQKRAGKQDDEPSALNGPKLHGIDLSINTSTVARKPSSASLSGNTQRSLTPSISLADLSSGTTRTPDLSTPPSSCAPSQDLQNLTSSLKNLSVQPDSKLAAGIQNPSKLITEPNGSIRDLSEQPHSGSGVSSSAQFDPPRQSRLLAFAKTSQTAQAPLSAKPPNSQAVEPAWLNHQLPETASSQQHLRQTSGHHTSGGMTFSQQGQVEGSSWPLSNEVQSGPRLESIRPNRSFSPFGNSLPPANNIHLEEARGLGNFAGSVGASTNASGIDRSNFSSPIDSMQQFNESRARNATPPTTSYGQNSLISTFDAQSGGMNTANYAAAKGSRFAKFFDGKSRDPSVAKNQNAGGIPPQLPRQDSPVYGVNTGTTAAEARNVGDILAMLNNSAQAQRANLLSQNNNLSNLISSQQQSGVHHGLSATNRLESLFDNEDGRFVADGMVPGLRPVAPRSRDASLGGNVFPQQQFEESLAFNPGRLGPQQRNVDGLYSGPVPPQFINQGPGGTRGSIGGFQQGPYRGGPSPINNFAAPPQRLPPGLANLGGRPPHDPSQFLGGGNLGSNLHSGVPSSTPPQGFNQFQGGGLGMGVNQVQMRVPQGGPLGPLNGLGGGGLEFRGQGGGPSQAQLLGMAVANGGGIRSASFGAHHGPGAGMHGGPLVGVRQQQQHLPPHLMQQMLPSQMQGQHSQSDLMALLMGGVHRE